MLENNVKSLVESSSNLLEAIMLQASSQPTSNKQVSVLQPAPQPRSRQEGGGFVRMDRHVRNKTSVLTQNQHTRAPKILMRNESSKKVDASSL